ncbi:MAG: D-aminoacylase [Tunicatimonas sp.]|uniref:N-acyl-D-amino-acid deacylase family protein n=1 Tax=Tunicatimonas sp. TaxID=1940096 RepID=UPI003C7107FD
MNLRLLVFLLMIFFTACQNTKELDIVIRNGLVYNGSSSAPTLTDIGIRGERIVAVGNLAEKKAKREIDATNLAVAPGFIDMHTHLEPLLRLPDAESHVRQGVTTALGGPDGSSPWPLGAYIDSVEQEGIGMNVAYLIGHNTIRRNIMKLDNRAPTEAELQQMQEQVATGMKDGAFGISTGLKYVPGAFSDVDEVVALSKIASQYGGIYTSHLREEGLGLIDAVAEAIQISERADIPVVLTHHKAIGKPMWGASTQTLAMVDSARSLELDIMMDQYPYTASQTGISVLIPSWARSGGQEAYLKRLEDPTLRDSIKQGIVYNILNDRGGKDLRRVQFARVEWQPKLEGKTLHDWVVSRDLEPSVENGAELVMEAQANGGCNAIYHAIDQQDVDRIMQHPQTMIGSDGRLAEYKVGHPHPRWYGTFPRVLGHYVRERNILSLEEAIHKMTLMPANRLGLKERGRIEEGVFADLTIFDPETIIDKATFEKPHQYSQGIYFVIVNGKVAVDNGQFTKSRGGKVLKGSAFQSN